MAKVRILKLPKAQDGASLTRQAGTGFNARQSSWPVTTNELSEPSLSERTTLNGVPQWEANLEAEKGEVAITNLNEDGIPESYKIGGNRHYDGGTPLNLPDKSFIFSRDKKMKIKDPEILMQFGITNSPKGGVTPADIAKKYDLNYYKKVLLDKNSEKLQRETAESMLINYNLKLGKLALLQESRKGFPNGIPFIAMPYLEAAGISPEDLVPQEEQSSDNQMMQDDSFTEEPQARFGMDIRRYQGGGPKFKGYGGRRNSWSWRSDPNDSYNDDNPLPTVSLTDEEAEPEYGFSSNNAPQKTLSNTPPSPASKYMPPPNPYAGTAAEKYWKNGKLEWSGSDPNELYKASAAVNKAGLKGKAVQGKTPGYNNFFGGLKPQDYERALVEFQLGKDTIKDMSEVDIRKEFFKILNVTAKEELLSDPESLYNDEDWFNDEFKEKFYDYLPEDVRTAFGNDDKFGFDHLDVLRPEKSGEAEASTTTSGALQRAEMGPVQKASEFAPWWLQDIIQTQGAFGDMMRLKKYAPWQDEAPVSYLQPSYLSPERELSANAEQLNIGAQGAATFTGPQQYTARFSAISGQASKNAADILGRYNNVNTDIANKTEQFNVDTFNQYAEKKANNATQLYDKYTIANQQFDNSKAQAREKLRNSYISGITNAANTQALNTLYPDYQVNPITGGTTHSTGKPGLLNPTSPTDYASNIYSWMERKPAGLSEKAWLNQWDKINGFSGPRSSTEVPEDPIETYNRQRGYPSKKSRNPNE